MLKHRIQPNELIKGLLVTLSAVSVSAQEIPTSSGTKENDESAITLDTYTVNSGFAGSLAAATEAKKENVSVVEVIMAEDIGKLPDISIADSLTRLTGLTTQRVNGRSQGISIRGLTGDFSTTTLNGREQVSSSLNRSVEFDNYPTELLNSVVVYKTGSAELTSQGIAGTIDLETVRPLSKSGRTVAISAYGQTTQLGQLTPGAKKNGERVNVSYVDQYFGGKLGVALGYAYSSTPWAGQQFQSWGYGQDASGNYILGGTKSYVRNSNVDRDGFMGVIEYKPNKSLHSTIDFYVSSLSEKQFLRGMEIPLYWSSAALQAGYVSKGGLVTEGSFKNVQPVIRNDVVTKKNDVYAVGWNLKIGDGSGWKTIFDAGYSRIDSKERNMETYSGLGYNLGATTPDTMKVSLTPGGMPHLTHTIDYSIGNQFTLTDPQGWFTYYLPNTGGEGYLKEFPSKDELGSFLVSTEHALNKVFKSVKVGANFTERYKRSGEQPTGYLYNSNGKPNAPLPSSVGTTDFSFIGLGKVYAYDPLAAYDSGNYSFFPYPGNETISNRWNVTEKISRGYFQFDIDRRIAGMPLTGNIGLQAINVRQSSAGKSSSGFGGTLVVTPVSGSSSYTDLAPSLNLNLAPSDQTFVRLSLARQIARPRMFDMRASRSFAYDPTKAASTSLASSPWSGDGGNPDLKPWKSDSIDLAFDRYFSNNKGYVSLALFHKKLLNYIYQESAVADFTGYPYNSATAPVLHEGSITKPVNGQGGSMQGVELTISLPSELLSSRIKGFGLVAGGAYTDSSVKPWGPTSGTAPISGLSRKVASITLYYERGGFSVRVSETYRSEYRAFITNFGKPNFKGDVTNTGFDTAQAERNISAQVSYAFKAGSFKGLTFFAQGYNLNNSPLVSYSNGDPRLVTNYQRYGASYSLGAAYKF